MKKIKLQPFIDDINLLLEQEGMNPLPDIFKHMVLAIYNKGDKNEQGFRRAIDAAFSSLLKSGYINKNLTLTPKGVEKNKRHASEPKTKSAVVDSYLDALKKTAKGKQ